MWRCRWIYSEGPGIWYTIDINKFGLANSQLDDFWEEVEVVYGHQLAPRWSNFEYEKCPSDFPLNSLWDYV